jgi:hypothetical protein
MQASIVRLAHWKIDIKIVKGDAMHILQWRRHLTHDEVLLDGKLQQTSHGLWGRETIYGLVFGRDEEGNGGSQLMFAVDPTPRASEWELDSSTRMGARGVRIETAEGPLLAYGTLDERAYDKPADFSEWVKKSFGMKW